MPHKKSEFEYFLEALDDKNWSIKNSVNIKNREVRSLESLFQDERCPAELSLILPSRFDKVKTLTDAISKSTKLTHLNLYLFDSSIGDKGFITLIKAIFNRPDITISIRVGDSKLKTAAIDFLTAEIKRATKIPALNIDFSGRFDESYDLGTCPHRCFSARNKVKSIDGINLANAIKEAILGNKISKEINLNFKDVTITKEAIEKFAECIELYIDKYSQPLNFNVTYYKEYFDDALNERLENASKRIQEDRSMLKSSATLFSSGVPNEQVKQTPPASTIISARI